MSPLRSTSVVLVLGALAFGCGGDDRPPPADSGPIVLFDGGPRRDGGSGRDGGGGACPPMTVPAPTEPACEGATLTCLMGCGTDGTCQQACLMADADAMGCQVCLLGEALSCATMTRGCDDEWGNFICCGQENCPTGSAPTCLDMECGPELMAADTCLTGSGCGNTMLCFMGG